MSSLQRSCCND